MWWADYCTSTVHALSAGRVGSVRRLVLVWEFGVCTRRGLIGYVRLSTAEGDGREKRRDLALKQCRDKERHCTVCTVSQ
jgi:hypothetical protein